MKFRFCECNFSSEPAGGAVSLCNLGHCSTCWLLPHKLLIAFQQRAALWFLCVKRPSWIIRAEYSGGFQLCGGRGCLLLYEWDRFSFKQSSILCFPDVTIPLFFFFLRGHFASRHPQSVTWACKMVFTSLFLWFTRSNLLPVHFLMPFVCDDVSFAGGVWHLFIFIIIISMGQNKNAVIRSHCWSRPVSVCVFVCVSCFPPTCRHVVSRCVLSLVLCVPSHFVLCLVSERLSPSLSLSACMYVCVCVSRSSVTNKGFNGVLGSLAFPFSEATWPAIATLMIVFQSISFHPIPLFIPLVIGCNRVGSRPFHSASPSKSSHVNTEGEFMRTPSSS